MKNENSISYTLPKVKDLGYIKKPQVFRDKFHNRCPYIFTDDYLTDEQISNWIEQYKDQRLSWSNLSDLFRDYVLSQGLCDVQE